VAVLTRYEPVGYETGFVGQADAEGRVLTVDFGSFRVASLYGPNAPPETDRMPIKQAWLASLEAHAQCLSDKPLILCGDLNVARSELDSRGESHPRGMNGCTDEERTAMRRLMETCHLGDPARERAGEAVISTWWPMVDVHRRLDSGLRLDYILLGNDYGKLVRGCCLHKEVRGSDHCPVSLEVELTVDHRRTAETGGQKQLW
jgi:exodeoxyribonuclease-3